MIDSASDEAGAGPDLKRARRVRRRSDSVVPDRLPPHAIEAEAGCIGCCLLIGISLYSDAKDCIPKLISRFRGDVEAFYDLRHQTILTHLFQMFENNKQIDIITLQQRLKDFELLEQIGGIPYLNSCQDSVFSPLQLDGFMDIVEEKWILRKMVQTCTDVVGRVYDYEGEVNQLLDEVERDVLKIRGGLASAESSGMKELVYDSIGDIENYFKRKGEIIGISTGFPDFDKMTSGLQNGETIVIAGRPSMGKTSLAVNIAENVGLDLKLPVGIFSLEMTKRALTTRMICSRARVNLRNVIEGFMSERDFPKLTSAAGQISNSPIRIDDTPGLSIMELRARARSMWQRFGIKLFVIDYLQLLHSKSRRSSDNRQQEIADISSGIKALAKELNVPIIVLSQLNRELDKEKNRKPRLSDLRESGAIEQDADLVGLLYKVRLDDDEAWENADAVPVNLLIAKQRNGPTGDVNLTFLKSFTRFESAARVSDDDVPPQTQQQREFNT